MAVGMNSTNLANKWLDMLGGTAFTAPATTAVKLHTADPGAAATTAASSVTTRPTLTWAAASVVSTNSVKAISNTPTWASWAGTSPETLTHISVWDSTTAGNFLFSAALTTSKTVTTGDTFTLSGLSFSLGALAA
jgi:hypothetical protein